MKDEHKQLIADLAGAVIVFAIPLAILFVAAGY